MEKTKSVAEHEEEITLEEYLIYSARCGDLDGIGLCITEKIDLNTQDDRQNTALRIDLLWDDFSQPMNRHGCSQWS